VSDYEVVETVYGRYHKYEVVRRAKMLGGYEFYVRKDGKAFKGSYSSLSAAVAAAQAEG
jgi:hypothetical protein